MSDTTVVSADEAHDVNAGYVNAGTLIVTNGATDTIDFAVFNGTITNAGTMEVDPGSSLVFKGATGFFSTLENLGTLAANGGTVTVTAALVMSPDGELIAADGGVIALGGFLHRGDVQLANATLLFDQPSTANRIGPPNDVPHGTTFHLGGSSDVIAMGPVASMAFDPTTNTLSIYADVNGHPYELSEIQLTGTYTADEFSVQHGDVAYQASSTAGIDVYDSNAQVVLPVGMTPYTGPVSGLDYQYVSLTADSLNITATTPNAFIHTGAGLDGLTVSSGNNVLDADGSAFMIGGTGQDTFYMDARGATQNAWSTIVNFHSGDEATAWGVNANDFTLTVLDNQGAAGAKGLDLIFSAPNHVVTSFVLAGYTSADLTNGLLSLSYGATADLPGLPGSDYVTVRRPKTVARSGPDERLASQPT